MIKKMGDSCNRYEICDCQDDESDAEEQRVSRARIRIVLRVNDMLASCHYPKDEWLRPLTQLPQTNLQILLQSRTLTAVSESINRADHRAIQIRKYGIDTRRSSINVTMRQLR